MLDFAEVVDLIDDVKYSDSWLRVRFSFVLTYVILLFGLSEAVRRLRCDKLASNPSCIGSLKLIVAVLLRQDAQSYFMKTLFAGGIGAPLKYYNTH